MMTTKRRPEPTALDAFIAKKAEFDAILARLQSLSAEHFNLAPDQIQWGHVGDLEFTLEHLREIRDSAFHEGEYAA